MTYDVIILKYDITHDYFIFKLMTSHIVTLFYFKIIMTSHIVTLFYLKIIMTSHS